MELSAVAEEFQRKGVNVYAITYGPVRANEKFAGKHRLTYPLLTDVDSVNIKAMGLLNEGMKPGTKYYGVPYPGIFVVDRDGIIQAKLAEENYRERPSMELVKQQAAALYGE